MRNIKSHLTICVVTTAFPRWKDDFRGAFVYQAVKALQRRGHQVQVIAMHNPGAKEHEILDGVEIHRPRYLPDKFEVLQKDSAGIPSAWKKNPWARLGVIPFFIKHSMAVGKIARNCDVIHANWSLSAAAAWFTGFIHHRPYVVTIQGSDIFQAPKTVLIKWLTRIALNRSRKVIALSNSLSDAAVNLGIPKKHIVVIPNGVNTSIFPFNNIEREPIILFVGSLIERKGVEYLLKAFRIIVECLPDYHLVIVGEGEQYSMVIELINELSLHGKVDLLGTLSQDEISKWMQKAKVFVMPSLEEGQGVVLVEAMSSGTPVIGSSVGGILDVITTEVGRLVPPGNPETLSKAIIEVVNDEIEWKKMSNYARTRAKEIYDWDLISERIESVYHSVI